MWFDDCYLLDCDAYRIVIFLNPIMTFELTIASFPEQFGWFLWEFGSLIWIIRIIPVFCNGNPDFWWLWYFNFTLDSKLYYFVFVYKCKFLENYCFDVRETCLIKFRLCYKYICNSSLLNQADICAKIEFALLALYLLSHLKRNVSRCLSVSRNWWAELISVSYCEWILVFEIISPPRLLSLLVLTSLLYSQGGHVSSGLTV